MAPVTSLEQNEDLKAGKAQRTAWEPDREVGGGIEAAINRGTEQDGEKKQNRIGGKKPQIS